MSGGKSRGAAPVATQIIDCRKCPLRPLPIFRAFTETELAFMRSFKSGESRFESGSTVLMQGTHSAHLYTLLSGWALRYKTLPDGRRQILNFALPGDLIGLQSAIMEEMQHSVETLTDCVFCLFPRDRLWDLFKNHPTLAFDVTWLTSREEDLIGEHLTSVGRRHAIERVAFLLLHLYRRAEQVGLAGGDKASFPFTQQHVADALGMSVVHTNKTIRRLVEARLIRWKERQFAILDRARLAEIALYDLDENTKRPLI